MDAVGVLLIANGLGIPVRPFVGYIADNYFGPINVYMVALTCLGIVTYSWIAVSTRVGMYVWAAIYGTAVGGSQGTFVGALTSLTDDPQKMGTRYGMISTLCAFAVLAGPPTAGAIIERSGGDWLWAQVWGGTIGVCGAMSIIACRIAKTGFVGRAKV